MIAVLTGDIINSRKVNSEHWLPGLKAYFMEVTSSDAHWQIYRGDSFQLQVNTQQALSVALCIKALIKTNAQIDVRISIGIGEVSFEADEVTQSNGTAFINSGEAFEKLKGNTLIMHSPFKELDEYFNPVFKLLSFIADNWKPVTSETIYFSLRNTELLQKEVAQELQRDKTSVNRALKRGGYEEVLGVITLFNKKLALCIH